MAINIAELWDFSKPELSEERFRSMLSSVSADDGLILQTQIARTYGLRGKFKEAQQILTGIEPNIQNASLETQTRYYLELGRTYSSAAHAPESQTIEAKAQARFAYLRALETAQGGNFDHLAIDALHMMTFVDTELEEQLEWNRKALVLMQASSQHEAKGWAGSLHNNTGYVLHLLGRYEDALTEFNLALSARKQGGNPESIRIAYWMFAWTLRALGRLEEAVEIQLQLEKECDEAGEPDPYVFEELALLYQALGSAEKASCYAERHKAAMK